MDDPLGLVEVRDIILDLRRQGRTEAADTLAAVIEHNLAALEALVAHAKALHADHDDDPDQTRPIRAIPQRYVRRTTT